MSQKFKTVAFREKLECLSRSNVRVRVGVRVISECNPSLHPPLRP